MSTLDYSLIIGIIEKIDQVKNLAFRAAMHDSAINAERRAPGFSFKMPGPWVVAADKPCNLENLSSALDSYLALVPEQVKTYLLGFAQEEFTHKYYNEIPLYEAEYFAVILDSLLPKDGRPFEVTLYDLNDQVGIRFPCRKLADAFIEQLGRPGCLFRLPSTPGEFAEEISCF